MKIRPLGDRVVVKRLEEQKESKGGIIIPDSATEKPHRGIVIAVGPGKRLDNGQLAEVCLRDGDTVVFGKYSGTEIKLDDVDYIVMSEGDILGVIEA